MGSMQSASFAMATGEPLSERQQDLLRIVKAQGFATVEALSRHFNVSTQTIRRDIIRLDEARLLQRFHGGAGMLESTVRLGYEQKLALQADAKERIGLLAAELVPDGAAIYLDVGTTVEAVARALAFRSDLRVFTNSLQAAAIMARGGKAEIFVTGGFVRGRDGSLVGESATATMRGLRLDIAILGFSGFDADGSLMDFDLQKVAVKQAVLTNARMVVAVGDSSKFGRQAIVQIASTTAFHAVVTDRAPPQALAERLAAAGVRVIYPLTAC